MGVPGGERRCPACGALVTDDAAWCGQCLTPLGRPPGPDPFPPPPPAPAPSGEAPAAPGAVATAQGAVPAWPCPVCGGRNGLDLDVCATCGTPFAVLMEGARAQPVVDPAVAVRRSLVFPGLGHRLLGRGVDGLARGVLFSFALLLAILAALAGLSTPALLAEFILFFVTALAVYVGSAMEARRLAEGGDLLMSSRMLLWATVSVVLVSGIIVTIAIVTAGKR